MKIAIIGTGVSGLVAAHLLHPRHDLQIFEANDYAGGHTNTIPVEAAGRTWPVDTGFIVFNDWTYPNFIRLLTRLGVASQPTTMSFSVRCERTGLEYNGRNLNTLFAQRRNLFRPSFHGMIRDILRFNREAPQLLEADATGPGPTLGAYLAEHRYGREFIDHYIVPMGAAIWSAPVEQLRAFPARFFVRFFANHGMLSVDHRPQWRVVSGGSQSYVRALTAPLRERIHLGDPVRAVTRGDGGVRLRTAAGAEHTADHVIIAVHGDEALPLLTDASDAERAVLGAFSYQDNEAVLHTDASLMPRTRRAWAAWNYHLPAQRSDDRRIALTYHMNALQGLDADRDFLVTLNPCTPIDPARVLRRIRYAHPLFTQAAVAAQRRLGEVSGRRGTSYCGAYWGYGFHEDGVVSALAACRPFGVGLE